MIFFITTAVKTSNPTYIFYVLKCIYLIPRKKAQETIFFVRPVSHTPVLRITAVGGGVQCTDWMYKTMTEMGDEAMRRRGKVICEDEEI
jgi:hypothetical protein